MGARSRRRDADLHALEVLRAAPGGALRRDETEREAGITAELHERHDRLALGLHLNGVIEAAGDDVGAAAHERLQGARAALEIGDLDLEAGVAEIAEALGHGEREIEQRGAAADREVHRPQLRPVRGAVLPGALRVRRMDDEQRHRGRECPASHRLLPCEG